MNTTIVRYQTKPDRAPEISGSSRLSSSSWKSANQTVSPTKCSASMMASASSTSSSNMMLTTPRRSRTSPPSSRSCLISATAAMHRRQPPARQSSAATADKLRRNRPTTNLPERALSRRYARRRWPTSRVQIRSVWRCDRSREPERGPGLSIRAGLALRPGHYSPTSRLDTTRFSERSQQALVSEAPVGTDWRCPAVEGART